MSCVVVDTTSDGLLFSGRQGNGDGPPLLPEPPLPLLAELVPGIGVLLV